MTNNAEREEIRHFIGIRCGFLLSKTVKEAEPSPEADEVGRELILYFREKAAIRRADAWADDVTSQIVEHIDLLVREPAERRALDLEFIAKRWPIAMCDHMRPIYSGQWPHDVKEDDVKAFLASEAPEVATAYAEQEAEARAVEARREGPMQVDAAPTPWFGSIPDPEHPSLLDSRTVLCNDVPISINGGPAQIVDVLFYLRLKPWDRVACGIIVGALLRARATQRSPAIAARAAWANVANVLDDDRGDRARIRIVKAALDWCAARGICADAAASREAQDELERALLESLSDLQRDCGMLADPPEDDAPAILAAEQCYATLARHLESIGGQGGKEASAAIREQAKQLAYNHPNSGLRWQTWTDRKVYPFARVIARALWTDRVGPGLLRNVPLLVHPVMVEATLIHSRSFKTGERAGQTVLEFPWGKEVEVRREEPLELPSVEIETLGKLLKNGVSLLGSVTAHKLFRWEVRTGYERAMRKEPDFRMIKALGGWSGIDDQLAAMFGEQGRSKKRPDEIHAIIVAQAHCRFLLPTGQYGNMLSYTVTPARGQRSGWVTIVLGDMVLPYYQFEVKEALGSVGKAAIEMQRLVPLVDLPPFVGRPQEHGQQATFSLALVTEFRVRARELAEHGGVHLPIDGQQPRMLEIAQMCDIPRSGKGNLPALLDRWTQDGDDAPAYLTRIERDRYTLNPKFSLTHAAALESIVREGKKVEARSAAGKRSVAAKQAKIDRVTRRPKSSSPR